MSTRTKDDLLNEINAHLPSDVDWKDGAVTYLRELVVSGGETAEWYHLVKPFVGGPDFAPFWVDLFHFWDVLHKVDLPMRSRVLDVGCGPGWTVHWLAKLGHHVIGLDISKELLAIAEQRMQSDPYPPFKDQPFAYELAAHDIEAAPLNLDEPVQLALFESTLHHFYDPVAVLQNVAVDLAPDGVLAVIEAAAPPVDSEWHSANVELMERYHTIERPYTRQQILDMLELAGYEYCQFFRPLHGLHSQDADTLNGLVAEMGRAENINIFVASQTAAGLSRIVADPKPSKEWRQSLRFLDGFYGEEVREDGTRFRWAGPQAAVRFTDAGTHVLHLSTVGLASQQKQRLFALVDGEIIADETLSRRSAAARMVVSVGNDAVVELQSDRVFSLGWEGAGDRRVLSFMLDIEQT